MPLLVALVLSILFAVAIAPPTTRAQFAYVIQDTNQAFGQCIQTSDCAVYASLGFNTSGIYCNAVTTRCETPEGVPLEPTYSIACQGVTVTTIAYPSYTSSFLSPFAPEDGMIEVDVSPATPAVLSASIRLYNAPGNYTISSDVRQQRSLNYPASKIVFRGLSGDITYQVQYYGQMGCFVTATAFVPLVFGSLFPLATAYNASSGFITVPGVSYTGDLTGRGARMSLVAPWHNGTSITDGFLGVGVGARIPYVQIYGIAGGVLDTVIGNDLFYNASVGNYSYAGGATFPLRAPATLFGSDLEATFLSGFVTFQFGIGYAYRACPTCALVFVTNTPKGDLEGNVMQPVLLDLQTVGPALGGALPPFTVTPMSYTLNGIYTNTQFLYPGDFVLSELVNLTTQPGINIIDLATTPDQSVSINAWCYTGPLTSVSLTVQMDYRQFPFELSSPWMTLYQVTYQTYVNVTTNTSLSNRLQLTPTSPPQTRIINNGVYPVFIDVPGFYCVALSAALPDGHGYHAFFQTCFQIDKASLGLTLVNARFETSAYPHNSSTPYGGIYSPVDYAFIGSMPTTFVLQPGYTLDMTYSRMTTDPQQLVLLLASGSTTSDLFSTYLGSVDTAQYYNVLQYSPRFYLLVLNKNIYSTPFYVGFTLDGGQTVTNELVSAAVSVYNTTQQAYIVTLTDIPIPGDPAFNETVVTYFNTTYEYYCAQTVPFQQMENIALRASILVGTAVCPDDFAAMTAMTVGGLPGHLLDPLTPGYNPALDSLGYYNIWTNFDNSTEGFGTVLAEGFNLVLVPAPTNILVRLTSCDARLMCATATAIAFSAVSPNATVISFFPQVPVCAPLPTNGTNTTVITNSTQYVQQVVLSYALNNEVAGRIEFWAPNDNIPNTYNPNSDIYNIPSDCALLGNQSAYSVYVLCGQGGSVPPQCTGCTKLPVQYQKANGRTLTTAAQYEKWLVVVWTPTTIFNPETNRTTYCLTQLSIQSQIPIPLAMTFSQLQRTSLSCFVQPCFYGTFTPVVDPVYAATLTALVLFLQQPAMPPYISPTAPAPNQYLVVLGVVYNISLAIPNILCAVELQYQPSALGPVIVLVRTQRTSCNTQTADGTAVVYARYNDPSPDLSVVATTAPVCFYWPGRRGTAFAAADEVPILFALPINAVQPTLLPYLAAFGIDNAFTQLVGGLQQLMIYDRCRMGVNAGGCGCKNPSAMNFQLLEAGLNFAYEQFTIQNFALTSGGIQIERTGFTPAKCFGDTMIFNYTGFANAPTPGDAPQQYEFLLIEPVTNAVLASFGSCIVTNASNVIHPSPFGPFQVIMGPFVIPVPTASRGIGPSGNYTAVLRNCQTQCVATDQTFLIFPTPLLAVLSSAGTTCPYKPAVLTTQVIGGEPCQRGDNCSVAVQFPGGNITYQLQYTYCWKTPFTPVNCTPTYLPYAEIPGYYELTACDRNMCCTTANITIASPPPLVVQRVTTDPVCQVGSNNVTATFNVSGLNGPPYFANSNLTVVNGQTLTYTVVQTYNQTLYFYISDYTGCMDPDPITFRLADPGPVPYNISSQPSCLLTPTGTARVTSPVPVTCTWQSSGIPIPTIQTCTLTQVPYGAFLVATITTNIGCVAIASVNITLKTPIAITQVLRTTDGELGGPCIDNITLALTGGSAGPPYLVATVDAPGVNLTVLLVFNGTETVLLTGICRSIIYTVMASELDGACPVFFSSTDPQFEAGFSPEGIPGLIYPPPTGFDPCPAPAERPAEVFGWTQVGIIIAIIGGVALVAGILIVGAHFASRGIATVEIQAPPPTAARPGRRIVSARQIHAGTPARM
jgi:hypothetical protein